MNRSRIIWTGLAAALLLASPFAFAQDTQEKKKEPTAPAPAPTPRGEPEDGEKPPNIYGHEDFGCPMKLKGCAALVIDIPYTTGGPHALMGIVDSLETLKCKVDKAEEWTQVRAAVDSHVKRIKDGEGYNMVMEFIATHGEPETHKDMLPDSCGRWIDNDNVGPALERADLIKGVRDAAFHKVCSWFIYDDSCFSKATSKGFEEAENTHSPRALTCKTKFSQSCDGRFVDHAGFWANVSVGTSVNDAPCGTGPGGTTSPETQKILDILKAEAAGQTKPDKNYSAVLEKLWASAKANNASYYADAGYVGDACRLNASHARK